MDLMMSVRLLSGGRAVVLLKGRLQAVTARAVRARLQLLAGEGHTRIVCDLHELSFLDSSGLVALVYGLDATSARGGFLRIAGLSLRVGKILELTQLDRVFERYATVDDALEGRDAGRAPVAPVDAADPQSVQRAHDEARRAA